MAQVNYEEFMKYTKKSSTTQDQNRPYVRYFGLGDDGDSAIVRFNISSMDDMSLAVQSIHRVKSNEGKLKVVSCLRADPREPFDHCPLCNDEMRPQLRIFIQLLDYQQDEKGDTIAVPCTWEQPAKMRETLKSYIMEYGDLRDYVFKIVRQGKHGDPQVKYSIIPANQNIYKEEVFKKDFSAFETFNMKSRIVEWSFDEIQSFVATGDFPQKTPVEQKPTVEEEPVEQPKVEPVKPTPTSPLRPGQPIRSVYNGDQQESKPTTPVTRRYTY